MEKASDAYILVEDNKIDWAVNQRASRGCDSRELEHFNRPASGLLEISMQDACDSISQDRKIGRALVRLISTVIFCFFAAFALSRRPRTTLQWDQVLAVSNVLVTRGEDIVTDDTPLQFFNIAGIDDVYTWLSDTLVPAVFITNDLNGNLLPNDQRGRVALFNQVLGGVIIDVTRKEVEPCNKDNVVTELYPKCYDGDSITLERSFLNIQLNATEATQAIDTLKTSDKGINYYTKKLVVTIATYNGDFGGFSVTTLELAFEESGLVTPTSATNSARATPYEWTNAVTDAAYASTYVIWLLIIFYWGTDHDELGDAVEAQGNDALSVMRRLLRTLWKICAIGGSVPVFAAVWAVIEYQLNSDMFRSNLLKLADKSLEDDATVLNALVPVVDLLNSMTAWTYALALAGAILSIQLGLYTLFQLDFHPRLSIFTRTMSSALRQFVAFFVVWIIAFMIFVCVGSILFGSDVEEFSTRLLTAQACINMLFGTFDYSSIKKLQFAFIFYWCFMIVVNLVLINMTLAIVLDAYGVVREESYKGKTSLMLNGRIKGFCLDKFYSKDPARCAAASAEPVIANRLVSQVFKRISADIRKLPSEFVVLRNKVNPALLLHVLEAKLELDHQTDEQRLSSPTKLTAGLVKEMFPKANLSDEQLRNTFKYLHDGVAINKCAIKQAQRKDPDRERHMITSIQSCSADTTGSDIFSDRRSPRLAMLEQKMEHLLRDVLAVQATIRDVGLREVQ